MRERQRMREQANCLLRLTCLVGPRERRIENLRSDVQKALYLLIDVVN